MVFAFLFPLRFLLLDLSTTARPLRPLVLGLSLSLFLSPSVPPLMFSRASPSLLRAELIPFCISIALRSIVLIFHSISHTGSPSFPQTPAAKSIQSDANCTRWAIAGAARGPDQLQALTNLTHVENNQDSAEQWRLQADVPETLPARALHTPSRRSQGRRACRLRVPAALRPGPSRRDQPRRDLRGGFLLRVVRAGDS